jgi:hypothetical protein
MRVMVYRGALYKGLTVSLPTNNEVEGVWEKTYFKAYRN